MIAEYFPTKLPRETDVPDDARCFETVLSTEKIDFCDTLPSQKHAYKSCQRALWSSFADVTFCNLQFFDKLFESRLTRGRFIHFVIVSKITRRI